MAAAAVTASPAEHDEVTHPDSAPVQRAITRLAARCKSSISTFTRSNSSTTEITSGAVTFAPTMVGVPIAFKTRRMP